MNDPPLGEPVPRSGSSAGAGWPWLAASIAAGAALALVGLAVLAVRLSTDAVQKQAERRLAGTAAASAVAVEQNMRGLVEVVESFATRRLLTAALTPPGDGRPSRTGLRRHLEELRVARKGIAVVFVTDPAGVLLDILPHTPGIVGKDFSSRDWYRGVTARNDPYVSELYETAATGVGLITAAAVPVVASDGSRVGILVAGYRPDTIQTFVDEFADAQGARLTVADQTGHVIASPGSTPTKLVSQAGDPAVAAARAGRTGLIQREREDEARLVAYTPIRPIGWTLTAEVPRSVALAGLGDVKRTMLLATLLLALTIGAGGAALVRSLRRRHRSEQALRGSQDRLSLALDISDLGVWDRDLQSGTIDVSERMQRVFELPEGATVADVFGRVHPEDRPRVESAIEAAVRDGSEIDIEYRLLTPAGGTRRIASRGRVHHDGAGRAIRLTGVVADITERALAQDELHESRAFLDSVVENIPHMVFVKDAADLRFVRFNRAGEELVGVSRDELIGRTDSDLFPAEQAGFFIEKDREVLRSGELLDIEAELIDTPTGQRVLHTKKIPILGDDGEPRYLLGISEDITERRRNEELLQDARNEAERANQAKDEFLSRMSHELRTPLTAVLGFAELMLLDDLRDDQKAHANRILRAGRHLLDLVNEVLDIASIESGRLPMSIEPVSVADVAGEALDLLQPMARERGITMTSAAPAACAVHVRGDRQRLKQVLVNLLANAVKYNRDGGTIELTCSATDESVRISVRDTGMGIAAEHLDLLFVPFERLGAEASGVEGTGLGLPLSQRLAQSMGGTLHVESSAGVGSTFSVTLDRVAAPAVAAPTRVEPRPPAPGVHARASTVLYIEDNLSNINLIERVVGQRPHVTLLTALQGRLGIDLAIRHAPDLVLLDLNLPDMTGMSVLRRLRADPATATIPVVIVSADATPGQQARLLAAGASDYLTKPFNIAKLLALVDGVQGPPPIVPAPPADGVLDPAVIAELGPLVNETGGPDDLLGTFRQVTATALRDLAGAVATGDRDRIRDVAHSLKGASASLGAKRLAACCADLEQRSRDDGVPVEPHDVHTLERARDEALGALSEALGGSGPA